MEDIGDTWVKLQWTKGAEHNSPILYYTIQTRHFWALNEDDWKNASTCESPLPFLWQDRSDAVFLGGTTP